MLAGALALYVVAMAMTARANVPRNHAIRALGPPDGITDLAAARARFDESRWIAWNPARTLLTSTAFGLIIWSLVLRGRLDHAP